MNNQYFIGIDIGGTNVDALLVDQNQTEIAFATNPIRGQANQKPVDVVIQTVEELLVHLNSQERALVAAIGAGVPGRVDAKTGRVELAVNLAEHSIELGELLTNHFGVPAFVENDANAYAMAASAYLVDSSIKHLAFVTLGTGVGSGLILNGEIYHGANNMAGEIGHIFVHENEVRCQCGMSGCLETFVAGPAISRMAKKAIGEGRKTTMSSGVDPDAAIVFAHASLGDEVAQAIVQDVAKYLARAIQSMIMSFDLQVVMIGGGLSRAGDRLLQPILDEWSKMRNDSIMAAEMLRPEKLMLCPPDFRAGAWGAVAIAQHNLVVATGDIRSIDGVSKPVALSDLKPTV